MRHFNKYTFLALALFAGYSCAQIEEQEQHNPKEELVEMIFQATIEDSLTKTALTGDVNDEHRGLVWLPGDEIAICVDGNFSRNFTNANEEPASVGNFVGETVWSETYYAVYPSNAVTGWFGNSAHISISNVQRYAENTFATNMNPMVATAMRGETLNFRNLCGLLVVNLKGEESVKSISIAAYDQAGNMAQIAGTFSVNLSAETPALSTEAMMPEISTITMDCGDGVQLNTAEPTPFHFVMAPGEYSKIAVFVTTTDGKVMVKEGKNPLTIKRAEWVTAGTLTYVENISIDLSAKGTANSYIVSNTGFYSFDATTIGNGAYGFVDGAQFHTSSPKITPSSAVLLWEDRTGVIGTVGFDKGRVNFVATGSEGNALIAVKDEYGDILWSWHIWVTDQPQEHIYNTNTGATYVVMDRNIGSISAVVGENNECLFYQWGRKDPFAVENSSLNHTGYTGGNFTNLQESIANPTVYAGGSDWVYNQSISLWSSSIKTIYDPCPTGWRVPNSAIWSGIYKITDHDGGPYGVVFGFSDSDVFWYPDTPRITPGAYMDGNYSDDNTELWTSEYRKTHFLNYNSSYQNDRSPADGYPVRCMKDEGYETSTKPLLKLVGINDINSDGATVKANLIAQGLSAVSEKGFIWGTTDNLTLETATNKVAFENTGDFAYTITGLQHSTRYYVRAYATNEYGTAYSDEKAFFTPYEGNAVDLSRAGTANSYIVRPEYAEYAFNAAVKGNTTESVGEIESVEVLWETKMNSSSVNVGDIINDVTLNGNMIHFTLPFEPNEGNALIAVKDANRTILWSWHIWVVDFDPVETQATLSTGAVIMDRNLGAISVAPGTYESYGLSYQWGRKDPFFRNQANIAPRNAMTYEYVPSKQYAIEDAVQNPCVLFEDAKWNDDATLWSNNKTKHDPCPVGWVVSPKDAWEGICRDDNVQTGYFQLSSSSGTPTVYIPLSGYTYGDFNFCDVSYWGLLWMSEYKCTMDFYYEYSSPSNSGRETDNLCSVRCMKDVQTPVVGGGNDIIVDDYEW